MTSHENKDAGMTKAGVLEFIRGHRYAVEATVSSARRAQAAVIGFAIDDRFVLVFDTLRSSRKFANLQENPSMALVFGGSGNDDVRTARLEGEARTLDGAVEAHLTTMYCAKFPDGAERAATSDVVYYRVTPRWLRYSDFSQTPPRIIEWDLSQ